MMTEDTKKERVDREESNKEEITLKEEILLLNHIKTLLEEIRDLLKESKERERELVKRKTEKAEERAKRKFKPPTLDEVEAFCVEKNLTAIDPKIFFSYYDATKWRISKTGAKMTSWEAACISWNARNKEREQAKANEKRSFFDELANIHEDDPMDWGTI